MSCHECAVQAACGGCPMLGLARPQELAAKVNNVATALARRGVHVEVQMAEPPLRLGYRNRLRMQVLNGVADFFNESKRNGCPVVRPDLWVAITQLRKVSADQPKLLGNLRYLEVRVGDDGTPGLWLPAEVKLEPLAKSLGSEWKVGHPGIEPLPTLSYRVTDTDVVNVPLDSFVQVNSAVNRQLVASVLRAADDVGARSFVDLFCGSGNFAIPLASRGLTGQAVDNVGSAIAELEQSAAARDGLIQCAVGDARSLLGRLEAADLVIVDPPRAGLQGGYRQLAKVPATRLVLIGCKSSSFANDVVGLLAEGMELGSVTVFDMFAGTNHVEAMAILHPTIP